MKPASGSGKKLTQPDADYGSVRAGIVDLLQTTRTVSVRSLNAVMTATYWEIDVGSLNGR